MFLGLCIILAAFSVICNVTYDKLMQEDKLNLGGSNNPMQRQQQQQRPPPPVNQYGQSPTARPNPIVSINSYLLSIETADFWVVLMIVLAVGIGVTCLGFWCSSCAICCCTSGSRSRPSSVRPQDKEWIPEA